MCLELQFYVILELPPFNIKNEVNLQNFDSDKQFNVLLSYAAYDYNLLKAIYLFMKSKGNVLLWISFTFLLTLILATSSLDASVTSWTS